MNLSLLSGFSRRWLVAATAGVLAVGNAQGQSLNYAPASATNVAGTFTDLGTSGTAITTANTDDANSAAQFIGFTFNYNGTAFTQFVLNTNGFIKLGSAAPSAANLYYAAETTLGGDVFTSTAAADVNILAPFNVDLQSGTGTGGAEYRVATDGVAGSRVCTVQWKNVKDKLLTNAAQYDNFSFQVKLYEATGNIEFVYGPTVAATVGADAFRIAAVGIKGSGTATGQTVLANKTGSTSAWSTTVFITGAYVGSAHNYRRSAPADLGRTYRFAPTVLLANDAAVTALYTLGKVSSAFGSPVTAQVVVTNTGSTAKVGLPVTLTVSGTTTYTNTQTITTLASGASTTLTFTYPVTGSTGTNNLSVSIPADDLLTNNTQTATQAITTGTLSYIQGTTFAGGVGLSAAGNVLAVRYNSSAASVINTITPTFVGAAATGVTSTYQVLVYSVGTTGQPGTILYTSPVRNRPTITGATTAQADPVSIPNVAVNGSFFVGMRVIGADNIGIGYQTEAPLRTGAFFFTTDAGATWTDLNTQTISPRLSLDVTLASPTATRNEALAAALSLAPNPAHNTFTLSVPAGTNLRDVQASLLNALGQTVQTRQLTLSTAASTIDFNVNGLAAGVYSLQLKSGSETVVKRVVVE